ncbi:hypothetical protein [Lapidilactobacillus salsurivasis]
MKLFFAAWPLRIRLDFETSRGFRIGSKRRPLRSRRTNGPTRLRPHPNPPYLQSSAGLRIGAGQFPNDAPKLVRLSFIR